MSTSEKDTVTTTNDTPSSDRNYRKVREGLVTSDKMDKTVVVIVEGVNRIKRHTRAGADGGQGGIITREAPIHVSNVMLVVDVDGDKTTTRVAYRRDDVTKNRADGSSYEAQRSVRVSSKTGKEI